MTKSFSFKLDQSASVRLAWEEVQALSCSSGGTRSLLYEIESARGLQRILLNESAILNRGDYKLNVTYMNGAACSSLSLKLAVQTESVIAEPRGSTMPDQLSIEVNTSTAGVKRMVTKLESEKAQDIK